MVEGGMVEEEQQDLEEKKQVGVAAAVWSKMCFINANLFGSPLPQCLGWTATNADRILKCWSRTEVRFHRGSTDAVELVERY